jgi:hypothetical protein
MVLHTDSPHPHVHVVVKAMSEQGVRLNIKKATLRSWRSQFAANLRELGVAANATERAVRGETRVHKSDGFFRANERRRSTRMAARERKIVAELSAGRLQPEPADETVRHTRARVMDGWRAVATNLRAMGDHMLADQIRIFSGGMHAPVTEKAWNAARLIERLRLRNAGTPTSVVVRERSPPM